MKRTIVGKHVLYTFRRCPYAMRARTALAYAGIDYEPREISLKNKPAGLLALSPKGTVPVLVLSSGKVIDESLDIMIWAIQQSDPDNILVSTRLAEETALIEQCQNKFTLHLSRYKYPERFSEGGNELQHRNKALEFLTLLSKKLTDNAHFFGEKFSLSDMAIYPFVRQFSMVNSNWFEQAAPDNVQKWLTRWIDNDHFNDVIMRKYSEWKPIS